MMASMAGIVVRVGGTLGFLPASVARRLSRQPTVSRVPGSALGMTLVDGHVVPVLELGSEPDTLICELEGEPLALSGVQGIRCGRFEAEDGGVLLDGTLVRPLDLVGLVGETEQALRQRRSP